MVIPWLKPFHEALGSLTSGSPLVVSLATVDRDGFPRARSIVIRHVGDNGALWFTSDARSGKAAQLAGRSDAEIVAWIAPARSQFRFCGTVDSLGKAAVGGMRLRLWRELSDASRATFLWPEPGEPRVDPDSAFAAAVPIDSPMPDTFTALFLEPAEVEQLWVKVHPHARTRWRLVNGWSAEALNP